MTEMAMKCVPNWTFRSKTRSIQLCRKWLKNKMSPVQDKIDIIGRYQLNGQLIISTDGFERSVDNSRNIDWSVDISTDQSIYQLFFIYFSFSWYRPNNRKSDRSLLTVSSVCTYFKNIPTSKHLKSLTFRRHTKRNNSSNEKWVKMQ